MSNITINSLPTYSGTADRTNDLLPIYSNSGVSTNSISVNNLLNLASQPVGLTDSQTLTNKILTSPTISSPVLSGTVTGTYTIGGTPTFPSSVVTLTGSQTLTNKVLTSPTINSPTITNATLSSDTITGYTTSNTGTVYGIAVTTGTIGSAALASSSVTTPAIASGIQLPDKMKNPYKFSVYKSGSQTVSAGAWTLLAYDTEIFDTGGNFSVSTHMFTVPVAGFYQFNLTVASSGIADGGNIAIGINVGSFSSNPTYSGGEFSAGANSTQLVGSQSNLIQLSANQTVQGYVYTTSTTVPGASALSSFSGFLVSAT